jgi:hypothetical protein
MFEAIDRLDDESVLAPNCHYGITVSFVWDLVGDDAE